MYQKTHYSVNVARSKRLFAYLVAVTLWFVLSSGPAWAHRATIFAWVEGNMVHTQSKFSGGRKAKHCMVTVYDKEGIQLLEGKTDEEGEFSFKVPKKTELKVVLRASMGHMAEWTIRAEEITDVVAASENNVSQPDLEVATRRQSASLIDDTENSESPVSEPACLSRQEIKALIHEALDIKLTPITDTLADIVQRGPRLSDVIGGIGYIFGLVGIALYIGTRQKRK